MEKTENKLSLNADVGEGLETDRELYPFLDQANIACGGHAGDRDSLFCAVQACIEHWVEIGAHPSYPDAKNFGRKSMELSDAALLDTLHSQINQLEQVCDDLGARLSYVKPHGALYNDMMVDETLFASLLDIVLAYPSDLALMIGAMPQTTTYQGMADKVGVKLITEAFADRLYLDDGSLSPRSINGAVLDNSDNIITQALLIMNEQTVATDTGKIISMFAQSLCVHGDNPASIQAIPYLKSCV